MATRDSCCSGEELGLLLGDTDPLFNEGPPSGRISKRPNSAQLRLVLSDDPDRGRGGSESESGSSLLSPEEEMKSNSCDMNSVVVVGDVDGSGDGRRHHHRRHHHHGRHHDHCHSTVKEDKSARNKLIAVSGLCFVFMIAEIIGGLIANSLAIVSDASHLACDLAGFLVSLFAIWIAKKPPTAKMSFGYHRAEVLGALISVLTIWVITVVLVYLGVKRIVDDDYEVYGSTMLITAGVGVAFNILMGVVLHSGIANCDVKSSFGHGHSHSLGHGHSHGNGHSHSHGNGHSHSQGHGHSHDGHGHSHSENHDHHHHHDHAHSHSNERRNSSNSNNRVHFHGDSSHNSVVAPMQSSSVISHGNGNEGYHLPALNHNNNNRSEPWSSSRGNRINANDDDDDDVKLLDVSDDSPPSPTLVISGDEEQFDIEHKKRMNINVRAALVHVIGDFVQSIGVLIAAIIINYKPEYRIADPICTFIFSFLVLCTTISILKDVVSVIMEAVPLDVNYKQIKADLKAISGVMTVHSLNVWALTLDRMAVAVHLGVAVSSDEWQDILSAATTLLRQKHSMFQSTIQVELYEESMESCDHCHSD